MHRAIRRTSSAVAILPRINALDRIAYINTGPQPFRHFGGASPDDVIVYANPEQYFTLPAGFKVVDEGSI